MAKRTKVAQLSSKLHLREKNCHLLSFGWLLQGDQDWYLPRGYPGAEKVMVQKHQQLLPLGASSQWSDRMLCSRMAKQL